MYAIIIFGLFLGAYVWPRSVREIPLRGSRFSPALHCGLGINFKKGEEK